MAYNYIISSDDKEAAINKIEEIKNAIDYELDESNYDLEDDGLYSVIDELTTVSLFASPKLIIVKSAETIVNSSDKALSELYKAMNDMNSENVLIFLFYKGFDYSNEKLNKIKKYSSFIDIKLKNIPITEYIKNLFEADGYEIDSQAISLLSSYLDNLASVKTAVEVLKCYKCDNKKITDNDIKLMITKPLEDNVYQLVEAVIDNDKKRMFSCFKDLKYSSVQPSYLVSLLINKFQELYNVSILVKSNVSKNEIANIFNVSEGRAYYMMKNAKATTVSVMKKNLDLLNELELNIKSGKIDQNLGLELYFLN